MLILLSQLTFGAFGEVAQKRVKLSNTEQKMFTKRTLRALAFMVPYIMKLIDINIHSTIRVHLGKQDLRGNIRQVQIQGRTHRLLQEFFPRLHGARFLLRLQWTIHRHINAGVYELFLIIFIIHFAQFQLYID